MADDAVLWLWATAPMLPQALTVMPAWGFTYRSHLVWAKDRAGTGYWARSQHELLLIGTRGSVPAPSPGSQPASVITAPVGRHSEKPPVFAEIIETLFPTLPKVELFARKVRPGWEGWGFEATDQFDNSGQLEDSLLRAGRIDKRICVGKTIEPATVQEAGSISGASPDCANRQRSQQEGRPRHDRN